MPPPTTTPAATGGRAGGSCCRRRGWRPGWRSCRRAATSGRHRRAPSRAAASRSPRRPPPTPRRRRRRSTARTTTTRRGGRPRRRSPSRRPRRVVVDVQTHFLESGEWGVGFPQGACGEAEPIDCFSAEYWRDLVLAGSDTSVAVISAIPVVGEADPLSIDAMERGKALAAELCGDGRVLIQGHAVPDVGPLDAALAAMADVAAAHELCAWKAYTHAPSGWYLDDHDPSRPAVGGPFLQAARDTGVPVDRRAQGPVGRQPVRLARRHRAGRGGQPRPDVPRVPLRLREREHRGPVRSRRRRRRPPRAHASTEPGIGAGGNVYAELGSTWRTVMGIPDEAAHVLGKLLVAFGPSASCGAPTRSGTARRRTRSPPSATSRSPRRSRSSSATRRSRPR